VPTPPPTAFGVLPYDWESRRPWLDLPFPVEEYQGRLARVGAAMASRGVARLVLFGAPKQSGNLRWLANFDSFVGYTALVVPAAGDPVLVTDSLFRREPMQSGAWMTWVKDYRPARPAAGDPEGFVGAVLEAAGGAAGGPVGFVGEDFFPYFLSHRLRAALGLVPILDLTPDYLHLKAVKTEAELAVVRRAVAIGDAGLQAACAAACLAAWPMAPPLVPSCASTASAFPCVTASSWK